MAFLPGACCGLTEVLLGTVPVPYSLHGDSFPSDHEPEAQQAGGVAEQLTLVPPSWWEGVAGPFLGRAVYSQCHLPALPGTSTRVCQRGPVLAVELPLS